MFDGLQPGMSARDVLMTAGQPHTRLGDEYTYCARRPSGATTRVTVVFGDTGLQAVRS